SRKGEDTMKKPYEGLQPGTGEWMDCWRKNPELQQEMLEYKKRLKEEDDMEHKKVSEVVELEQQVEQAVEEVERILEKENFEEIVTLAAKSEEATDKKEPKTAVKKERKKKAEKSK